MAANVLVDTSFLVALLNRRDADHRWAAAQAEKSTYPWKTCESVLSEALHILGARGGSQLMELVTNGTLICAFRIDENVEDVLRLLRKYADVPMSLADACLVRMTEILSDPALLTADTDFHVYRRHGRQTIPCVTPH
jgi:uncharacterized protein